MDMFSYLLGKKAGGGGGDVTLETLSATENTTYNAPSGKAYNKVNVNVPGATLGTKTITANGEYDPDDDSLDGYSGVTVNVANSYDAGDEGKVVSSGALVAQTARGSQITENGTYDTTNNNSVTVNVSGGGAFSVSSEASPPTMFTSTIPTITLSFNNHAEEAA